METELHYILEKLGTYAEIDPQRINAAFELALKYHAGQLRKSGEPFIHHPLAVAKMLLDLEADEDAIIAALLHDIVEDTKLTLPEIREQFGESVAQLVDGVTKISKEKFALGEAQWKFQSLRKMFQIMGQDIRTILIKICDRLHNMQTLSFVSREKQLRIARETLEIYVPIAKRLNLELFRNELATLSSKILFPEVYGAFQKIQEEQRPEIEKQAKKITKWLHTNFTAGKKYQVNIFPRTYSISGNEANHKLKALELSDTHTIQIVTQQVQQCYRVFSELHQIYRGKTAALTDYISNPRANGYQALHTSIITEEGHVLSIQILTAAMARLAERGITIYWQGKKNSFTPKQLQKLPIRIKWLEDLMLFTAEEEGDIEEMTEYLQKDFLKGRIFVFDKFGKFLDLPKGATVLDFLYSNSPDQAGYVTKAFVNREEAPLDRELFEGDKIEFTHDQKLKTKIHWLHFVKTYSAKRRIQAELALSPISEKIRIGEKLLQREFDIHNKGLITRHGQKKWQEVWQEMEFTSFSELLQSIGEGQTKAEEVFEKFFQGARKGSRLRYVFAFSKTEKSPLQILSKLAEQFHIEIRSVQFQEKKKHTKISVEMTEQEHSNLDGFLHKIRNASEIRDIQMVLPVYLKALLIVLWSAVFILVGLFFFFREKFEGYHHGAAGVMQQIVTYVPFLAVMIVNMTTIKNMKNYIRRMRRERVYMAAGMFFNLISTLLIIGIYFYLEIPFDLSVILVLLLIGTLVTSYQFTRDTLDLPDPILNNTSLDSDHSRKQKILGYFFRIGAVVIFGINPIVVKYSLSGFSNIFVTSFSFFLAGILLIPIALARRILCSQHLNETKNPKKYHWTFFLAVAFDGLVVITYFSSIRYTIASNSALFLNFAPVVALVFMLIFFRKKIAYFQKKSDITHIVVLFLLGCLGSAFLVINRSFSEMNFQQKLFGDAIAALIVIFDVVATLSIIHYVKMKNTFSGMDFILRKVFILALFFAPFALLELGKVHISSNEWMAFLWVAFFDLIIAYYLAYEAYRRVDGLIVYLLMNLAPLITIFLEVFFFDLPASFNFILGAILILGASIGVEYLNSRREKQIQTSEITT